MRRRAAKTDKNQQDIINALQRLGCAVHSLHNEGNGCPDLLCSIAGTTFLIEVKNIDGKNKITPDQQRFHREWRADIYIVRDVCEAIEVVNIIKGTSDDAQLSRKFLVSPHCIQDQH